MTCLLCVFPNICEYSGKENTSMGLSEIAELLNLNSIEFYYIKAHVKSVQNLTKIGLRLKDLDNVIKLHCLL